jgi:DNA-binding response OmpR family regulator
MGRPVSRKEILSAIWGMGSGPGGPQSRSLDTHIGRLRSKLGLHKRASQAAGDGPSIRLDAVYGMGYQIDVFP